MRTHLPTIVIALFGIPWIIFGIQHFMYAGFVRDLVPAYMPARIFWVYLTGVAMIAAGISFIIRRQVRPAAFLLGCMLLLFILMLHPLLLAHEPQVGIHWTRVMQDIAIMGAAFGLVAITHNEKNLPIFSASMIPVIARYCYALPLIVLGVQHFTHNAFVTAKIPDYFPLKNIFDYLVGAALIAAAYGILFTANIHRVANALGMMLLALVLLYHIPLLVANPYNAIQWTGGMLDLALAAGAFIIARTAAVRHSGELLPGQ